MLKHLYIDNYKCMVNFEFQPAQMNLLLGRNGSGKSTVFEVLGKLREVVLGRSDVLAPFPRTSRTRWDSRVLQTFVIQASQISDLYTYRLEIEHERSGDRCRIKHETLAAEEKPLFGFADGEVHLYRDNHSEGPSFPADWSRSALATVPRRPDNTRLWAFKDWLSRVWTLAPNPRAMKSESTKENPTPEHDLSNIASWYRHAVQEDAAASRQLHGSLGEVLDGFQALNLKQTGEESRRLRVTLRHGSPTSPNQSETDYDFAELSDGQRALVGLYSLLHLGLSQRSTLCIDEPDNFIALPELQPWLVALRERTEETGAQVFLISHNPEVINYLAPGCGRLFERSDAGPVRVRDFSSSSDTGLTPAELLARGWE